VFEESTTDIRSVADTACTGASLAADGFEVLADVVGEVRAGQVTPKIFDRVELRSVGRQIFDREPRSVGVNVIPHLTAAMGGQPIP
jgi:hypothetical protein